MKVIKAGHIYELSMLDGEEDQVLRMKFVCREQHLGLHPGVQSQEVLRVIAHYLDYVANTISELQEMLIDRTNHCDSCLPWQGNERVIKALSESARQARLALLIHEQRALERDFERGKMDPAAVPVGEDGHYHVKYHDVDPHRT